MMLGGIKTPSTPPDAVMPAASFSGYCLFFISGIMIDPIAAAVAGDAPEMAEKNAHENIVVMPSPPLTWPITASEKLTMRRDRPPQPIRVPAKMNRGMAIQVCDAMPV